MKSSDHETKPLNSKQNSAGSGIQVRSQPGYYPGYNIISQQAFWDKTTREVVLKRLADPPELKFFQPEQAFLMQAILNRLIPQDDREEGHKVPLLGVIDERLYKGRIDGYRYENMQPDREAYVLGLQAIDEMSVSLYGKNFVSLGNREQEILLKSIHDDKPAAEHEVWQRMPPTRFWMLILQDAIEAYYAHPFAWNEIGFGGPAYPRAYTRLERGEPEPWEVEEQRYDWAAPPDSISDTYEPIGGTTEHHGTPGQGGSH